MCLFRHSCCKYPSSSSTAEYLYDVERSNLDDPGRKRPSWRGNLSLIVRPQAWVPRRVHPGGSRANSASSPAKTVDDKTPDILLEDAAAEKMIAEN